jgi:4-hydroxybenzoate polyprenyltransferase
LHDRPDIFITATWLDHRQDGTMPSKPVALALSTHPGPAVAVTAITVVLGVGVGLEPWRLLVLGAAMLFNQLSVGLSNDWIDADRDRAVQRSDKPVARGWISASAVRTAAWTTAGLSIAVSLPLGIAAAGANAIFIASAWTYNAGLKNSWFSVAPYIVSFGILPAIVTLSRSTPAFAAPWALATGAALGIAAHFANVLPDLDDDRVTGVRGLPHRLGRRAASVAAYIVLAAAAVVAFIGVGGIRFPLGLSALVANGLIAIVGITLAARPTRWHFRLIILAAIVDVALLAFAGDRLLWN